MLIIALRDYNAAVRTKAFLVSLVLLPVMMLGSIAIQALLKDQVDTRPKRFAVIDRTGDEVFPLLDAAASVRNQTQLHDGSGKQVRPEYVLERVGPSPDDPQGILEQRLALSDRVRAGELAGFVEIGPDVHRLPSASDAASPDERLAVRYQAHSHLSRDFIEWLRRELNNTVLKLRCQQKGLAVKEVQAVQQPVPLLSRGLTRQDPRTGAIEDGTDADRLVSFLLPLGLVMLSFMMIFVGSTPLMQGVVEEKMQRIAEVLLGSVRPFPLMMGKLLGTVGVVSTLAFIYLGGGLWAAYRFDVADQFTWQVLCWFLVYLILGVLLYGSIFIAVGSACTNIQETQTLLLPVMMLAMLPMFVLSNVVREPDSPLATWASLFPPATPMLMTARMALLPGLPAWQPALGGVLVLLTTLLCVYIAGRIFRVGLLMQGKGASFADLARWVIRG
jgi:ABC-2 type transport system permease protein